MLMDWQRSVKMAALLKAIYRFNTIPTKILTQFFTEIGRTIFRFTQEGQAPRIAETVLSDERTLAGITVPDCESDSRAPVIKNIVGTKTGTLINGTEKQDVSLYTCGLLIFFFLTKKPKLEKRKQQTALLKQGCCAEEEEGSAHHPGRGSTQIKDRVDTLNLIEGKWGTGLRSLAQEKMSEQGAENNR